MWERYSLIGVTFSVVIIILDFYLLKKRKIHGRIFVFWFLTGVLLGLFSGFPPLLSLVLTLFGTEFTISAFVGAGFLFFLLAIFYLHYKISELHSMLMKLAMEVSVAKYSQKQSDPSDSKPKKRKNQRK